METEITPQAQIQTIPSRKWLRFWQFQSLLFLMWFFAGHLNSFATLFFFPQRGFDVWASLHPGMGRGIVIGVFLLPILTLLMGHFTWVAGPSGTRKVLKGIFIFLSLVELLIVLATYLPVFFLAFAVITHGGL